MGLRNGISVGIRKKDVRSENEFDCVEGAIYYAGGRMDFVSGNLNSNLQARFCKTYPTDSVGCNSLVFVFLAFRIYCVSFSSKIPPDDPRS